MWEYKFQRFCLNPSSVDIGPTAIRFKGRDEVIETLVETKLALNRLGRDGWEAVTATHETEETAVILFKREIRGE